MSGSSEKTGMWGRVAMAVSTLSAAMRGPAL